MEDNWLHNRFIPTALGVYFYDLEKSSNTPPVEREFIVANNGDFILTNGGDFIQSNN